MDTSIKLYDTVMANLRAKRIPQRRIAAASGVPFSTLTKIAQGRTKDPSVHHIQALYDFFKQHELRSDIYPHPQDGMPRIEEAA